MLAERWFPHEGDRPVTCPPPTNELAAPAPPVPMQAPAELLGRIVAWATQGLSSAKATRLAGLIARQPHLAAWHSYALGYLEGSDDARAALPALPPSPATAAPEPIWRQTPPQLTHYPPTRASTAARAWHCRRCGNLLGLVDGSWLISRHKGREIAAPLPVRVRCERCGQRQLYTAPLPSSQRIG